MIIKVGYETFVTRIQFTQKKIAITVCTLTTTAQSIFFFPNFSLQKSIAVWTFVSFEQRSKYFTASSNAQTFKYKRPILKLSILSTLPVSFNNPTWMSTAVFVLNILQNSELEKKAMKMNEIYNFTKANCWSFRLSTNSQMTARNWLHTIQWFDDSLNVVFQLMVWRSFVCLHRWRKVISESSLIAFIHIDHWIYKIEIEIQLQLLLKTVILFLSEIAATASDNCLVCLHFI